MSGTMDPGKRSSADIEHEVERTRAGLTETLEELRDRASPGQLFEQALDYAKTSGGAEFTRNLGAAVRDNPLPLLLIGAGIGWLMLGQGNTRSAPQPSHRSGAYDAPRGAGYPGTGWEGEQPGLMDRAGEAVGDAADAVRDATASAYRSVAGAVGTAGEQVRDAAGSASRSLRGGTGQASDYADRTTRAASAYARDAQDQLGRWTDEAGSTAGWVLREQPLVLGALGIALGAAVGALLPGTDAEDRLMGETRDGLAEQAGTLAQEGYAKARETLGGQAEQARDAAGGAAGLAGQAREAMRDAAQTLAANAKAALAETPEPANGPATAPHPDSRPAGLG